MIRTESLTVVYGNLIAVRALDLEVPRGEVVGLIGPNGAGKSSTLRVLATVQEPTWGRATIDGLDIDRDRNRVHHLVGFMPDFFSLYEDLKLWEYLDYFAAAYHVPRQQRRKVIDEVIELTDLQVKKFEMISALSRGMRQRLLLAKTLIHNPQVLLLDEPASGLDPKARIEFRGILHTLKEMGKTILVSSHILTEMSEFCTSICIMERGQLVLSGRVDEVAARIRPYTTVQIAVTKGADRAHLLLREKPYVREFRVEDGRIEVDLDGDEGVRADLARSLVEGGLDFAEFRVRKDNLEDIFIEITGGGEVS